MPERSLMETFVAANYATDTLVNGNISECITYLKDLLECGSAGVKIVYEELDSIKANVPDRYNFVYHNVFSVPRYSDFKQY
jgi:hypothetical protein